MDVVTDVLILIVPMLLLWPLQLALRRKLVLMGMMSLSAFMIAIAIVRVTGAQLPNGVVDTSWLVFWSGMESAVSVLMVSLLVLKSMFGIESERRSERQRRLDTEKGILSSSSSPPSTPRRSWRSSFRRSPQVSIDQDQAQESAWNPVHRFALPQAHCKPPSGSNSPLRSVSRQPMPSYSRLSRDEIEGGITRIPPPRRSPTPSERAQRGYLDDISRGPQRNVIETTVRPITTDVKLFQEMPAELAGQ
jgi:hypothetical protein